MSGPDLVEDLLVDGVVLLCFTAVNVTHLTTNELIQLRDERPISLIMDDWRHVWQTISATASHLA